MKALVFLLAVIMWLSPAGAPAQTQDTAITEADRGSIRQVIERQLAAFRRDDGPEAFSYASPNVRRQFGTPQNFMRMVQTGYAPVYRPRMVEFRGLEMVGDVPAQKVFFVGPDGVPVMAIYPMQKQPNGDWKIDGCMLVGVAGKAI